MKNFKISTLKLLWLGFKIKPIQSIVLYILVILSSVIPTLEIYALNNLISKINIQSQEVIIILVIYVLIFFGMPQLIGLIRKIFKLISSFYTDILLKENIIQKAIEVKLSKLEFGELHKIYSRNFSTSDNFKNTIENLILMISNILSLIILIISNGYIILLISIISFFIGLILLILYKKISELNYNHGYKTAENKKIEEYYKNTFINRKNACEMFLSNSFDNIFNKWSNERMQNINNDINNEKKVNSKTIIINLLKKIRILIITFLLLLFFYNNLITNNKFIIYFNSTITIIGLCDGVISYINYIIRNKKYINEYNRFINEEEENENQIFTINNDSSIEFCNVSYKYPGQECLALKNVSFKIYNNEKICLVGANGSGKSTIIRLLLGFDTPTEGNILINGIDINKNIKFLRSNTSVMFQKFYKYELSLINNIVISNFKDNNDYSFINETIKWAEIGNIINKLDKGLETEVINGGTFSGGEWQKIALARAKFKDAKLIILDEPNAAIDPKYEIKMYNKFISLFENSTALIVSHRLSVCQICDKILYMENGCLKEFGTHKELCKIEDGKYKSLYNLQADLYK